MKTSLLLLAGLSLTTTLAFAAEEAGFVPLFNGKDTTGWHLRRKDGHNSWSVENGILKNTVNPGEHGTDLFERGVIPAEIARRVGVRHQIVSQWRKAWREGGQD